jgi:putative hydrolase of the HAD superfamily
LRDFVGKRGGYDAVFLDVDGTLLWVDVDVEGYVRDLAPYASNGGLTVEKAAGPLRQSMRRHIDENIRHRTEEALAGFKRENAARTAEALGIRAPARVLAEVADRRISFNPYPETGRVLEELRAMGHGLYVLSNWDVMLEAVLEDLGWRDYFDGLVVSAVVGVEKPDPGIFEEALALSGARPERAVHVGNDPVADVRGAAACGLDTVFVNRKGLPEVPEATYTIPDLSGLPEILRR